MCEKKTVSGKVNFTGKFYYKKVGREAYHYCIRCKILKLKCIVDRVDHCESGSNSQWLYHYRQSRNSKIILLCKYARSGGGRYCLGSLFQLIYRIYNLWTKRIEYILEGNLLEKSVKRPFCCTVSHIFAI